MHARLRMRVLPTVVLVLVLLTVNGGWVRHEDRRRDGSGGLAERTYK